MNSNEKARNEFPLISFFTYPLDEGFGSVYVKHATCGSP